MKNCNCQNWLVGIKSILAQSSIASIHMTPYTGTTFKYCPWCAKELLSESATESSEVQKPSDNKQSKTCLGCRRNQIGSTECLTCSRINPVIIDKWEA
jgi:hypothetical protein